MAETLPLDEDDWEVMEIEGPAQPTPHTSTASRFFNTHSTPRKPRTTSRATPERKRKRADSLEEIATPRASRTLVRRWSGDLVDMTVDKEKETSAESSNTTSRCASPDTFSLLQDLSSPVQPDRRSKSPEWVAAELSSPVSTRKPSTRPPLYLRQSLDIVDLEADPDNDVPNPVPMLTYTKTATTARTDFARQTPRSTTEKRQNVVVDLREVFSQESVSEIGTSEEGPWTPSDPPALIAQVASNEGSLDLDDAEYISDDEEQEAEAAKRQARVAQGWVAKYGFNVIKGRKVCLNMTH
jgi:hypothetical protein